MARFAVLVPAAGSSRRFGSVGGRSKIHAEVGGKPAWVRAVEAFAGRPDVGRVILAVSAAEREWFLSRYADEVGSLGLEVVEGGEERVDSVERMLRAVGPGCDHVAVHDAARPLVSAALIDRIFAAAVEHGAALPGVAVADTLKRVGSDGTIVETVSRAGLHGVQTPQAFRRDLIERAYAARDRAAGAATDDAMLVEAIGHPVRVVAGSALNLKITTPEDLELARAIVQGHGAGGP